MNKRILVPLGSTSVSQEVIQAADLWAKRLDGKIHFLHTMTPEIQKLVNEGDSVEP